MTSEETLAGGKMSTAMLKAAFPELDSDPPTHWLAPWEATDEMASAFMDEVHESPDAKWAIMRDAYLKTAPES